MDMNETREAKQRREASEHARRKFIVLAAEYSERFCRKCEFARDDEGFLPIDCIYDLSPVTSMGLPCPYYRLPPP